MESRAGTIVAAACLAVLGCLMWQAFRIDAQVSEIRARNLFSIEDLHMGQTISSSWVSGGITHTITTPKNPGESDGDWLTRHDSAVRAAKVIYPPDP